VQLVNNPDAGRASGSARPPTDTELLSTLFELGREVTSVLDLDELLAKIPQLIARLTRFSAFSVYLLDEKRQELRIAYAIGYPEHLLPTVRLPVGQGVVGAAVEEGRPILVNDIRKEPRYRGPLRNMLSQLAVPMRRKGRVIGALNLLDEAEGAFSAQDEAAAAVRGARRRRHRERAPVRVGAAVRRDARDAGGDRP
jgi:phosphoserine phosphatase RsbU/P